MGDEETEARTTTAGTGAPGTRRVLAEHRGEVASAALLVGGAVSVLVAVVLVPGIGPQTRPFAVGVLIALAVVTTVVGLGNRHGRRQTWPPPRLSFAAAVLALGAAAVLVTAGLVVDLRGGLVDPDVPVLLLGLLAWTAGAVGQWLLTPSRRAPRVAAPAARRHRSVPALAGLGGALVVLLACWAVGAALAGLPERSVTAADDALAAPAPTLPTEVAWTVEVPGERVVPGRGYGDPEVALAAAGSGVAYGSDSSVVALDGETGEERWRYELSRASLLALQGTPGGETVVATYASGSRDHDHPVRRVVLDGVDGEVLHVRRGVEPPLSGSGVPPLDLTARHVVDVREDGVVEVRGLDGTEGWERPAPDGCGTYASGATARLVVVLDVCEESPRKKELRVVALDPVSADEVWRDERLITVIGEFDEQVRLTGASDGSAVRIEVVGGGEHPLVDVVLAAEDGRAVTREDQLDDFNVVDFSATDGAWGWAGGELSSSPYERRSSAAGEEVLAETCGRGDASRGGRLVVACPEDDGYGSITSVQLQPWAGGPAEEVTVDPPLYASSYLDRTTSVVTALPGLVVLTTLSGDRLVGLR